MFCNAKLWAINQGYVFINYAYFSLLLGLMKYPRIIQLHISFFFSNLSQISIKCVIDRHNRIRSNQTSFFCWYIPCFILVESVKIDMIFLDSKQLQQMLMVIICKSSKHKWKIEWLLIYFDIILEKKKLRIAQRRIKGLPCQKLNRGYRPQFFNTLYYALFTSSYVDCW